MQVPSTTETGLDASSKRAAESTSPWTFVAHMEFCTLIASVLTLAVICLKISVKKITDQIGSTCFATSFSNVKGIYICKVTDLSLLACLLFILYFIISEQKIYSMVNPRLWCRSFLKLFSWNYFENLKCLITAPYNPEW